VNFIGRKANWPGENPMREGTKANWMEEMKKIQGHKGPVPMGGGGGWGRDQGEIGGKICQKVAMPPPAHFLRF
jgi:hypothetical protein